MKKEKPLYEKEVSFEDGGFDDVLILHSAIWYDYIKDNAEWINTDYFNGQEFAEDFENLGEKIKEKEEENKKALEKLQRELKEIKMKPIRTKDLIKEKVIIADYVYWKDFRKEIDTLFEKIIGNHSPQDSESLAHHDEHHGNLVDEGSNPSPGGNQNHSPTEQMNRANLSGEQLTAVNMHDSAPADNQNQEGKA